MIIAGRTIHSGDAPFIIAEIGVNHDGDPRLALDLVERAARAGADAVKFQLFRAEALLSRRSSLAGYQAQSGERDPLDMLRRLELPLDSLDRCVRRAHDLNLAAIATLFNVELVPAAAAIPFDAFKTASPDIIHAPLLAALSNCGRPMIVSTGAATLDEIARAVSWLAPARAAGALALLQCVSAYPTPDADASLGAIGALARAFPDLPVGYSDHTTATDTGALAVAAGACILEKHLTHSRAARGPDHATSLEPADFAHYARLARRAHSMLGAPEKRVRPCEIEVRRIARQCVVARRPIAPGEPLDANNLSFQRPGGPFEPARVHELLGRVARAPIPAGEPIAPEMLV